MDVPVEDMVIGVAEMVKLGVGAVAAQRCGASARRTAREARALLLIVIEASCNVWRNDTSVVEEPVGCIWVVRRQLQKQIPGGNDRKKGKGNGRGALGILLPHS